MDDSAQQAVNLGFNVTVFIIALSISVTLLLGVRDAADKALEYDASIPTGSVVISDVGQKKRIISGDEILSYYIHYMGSQAKVYYEVEDEDGNIGYTDSKFNITVENSSGTKIMNLSDEKNLKNTLVSKGINLDKNYEVITEKYDSENEILSIILKEID